MAGASRATLSPFQAIRLHCFVTEMIAILRVSNVTPSYQFCSMSDSSIV